MEEKNLTQQESLELISKMIKETRTNMERDGGGIYLLWGYVWLIVSAAVYLLMLKTGDYRVQWLWFAIPLVGYPGMFILLRKREKRAVTFVGRVIGSVWITIGIAAGLLSLYMLVNHLAFPILFVMALLINIGVAISGLVIKFMPITIAGFIGILLSFVLLMVPGIHQIAVFGAFSIIMLIIPGHILAAAGQRIKKAGNHV